MSASIVSLALFGRLDGAFAVASLSMVKVPFWDNAMYRVSMMSLARYASVCAPRGNANSGLRIAEIVSWSKPKLSSSCLSVCDWGAPWASKDVESIVDRMKGIRLRMIGEQAISRRCHSAKRRTACSGVKPM